MKILGIDLAKPSLYWLLPFIILTVLMNVLFPEKAAIIFIFSCISIIPLAALLSDATSEIAEKAGDAVGGFLNATFGNATEFIIAIVALYNGKIALVKATLIGSILGNILLVLGLSFFAGGIKNKIQNFNKLGAETFAMGLTIAVIALITPAAYAKFAVASENMQSQQLLSNAISIVLIVIYFLFIYFSLFTHKKLLATDHSSDDAHHSYGWSLSTSIFLLFIAAFLIAVMSEILVKHVEHAAQAMGISMVFVGIIIVAIVGNAAEHSTAVIMAMKNKMDISIGIAIGSSIQIALFVAPVLVLLSAILPIPSMDLIFSRGEILLIILGTLILNQAVTTGESTWFQGVQLLGVYAILGIALYFVN